MGTVIAFPSERTSRRESAARAQRSAEICILPVVRIERHPTTTLPPERSVPGNGLKVR